MHKCTGKSRFCTTIGTDMGHPDHCFLGRVLGGQVLDVFPFGKLLDQPVVGGTRTDLCHFHDLDPVGIEPLGKMVQVPIEKEGHIQADMAGVKAVIAVESVKGGVQMLDIVHAFFSNSTLFDIRISSISIAS